MKRPLRIKCVIIVLVFAALTVAGVATAFAVGDNLALSALRYGSGTETDPYRIYDTDQMLSLQEIAASPMSEKYTEGKYFRLCADVVSRHGTANTVNGFRGVFDGGGHKITLQGNCKLFYRLESGAVVKNLNFVVNLDVKSTEKFRNGYSYTREYYGCFHTVGKGATIENCSVVGKSVIDYSAASFVKNFNVTFYASYFCRKNDGVIRDCDFDVDILDTGNGLFLRKYISAVAHYGTGSIESCVVRGRICTVLDAYQGYYFGIAYNVTAVNCRYEGDIIVSQRSYVSSFFLWSRWQTMIGISGNASDCTMVGDITAYTNREAHMYMGGTTHDGKLDLQFNKAIGEK